jgi:two-component system nitrate/nitrite response regulator NarL
MNRVTTLLIEKNSFIREGLKSLLVQSHYDTVLELKNAGDAATQLCGADVQLVVCGVDEDSDDATLTINTLKSCFRDARIVILSQDMDSILIRDCFSAGADGFILKDISASAFIGSLNLIMLGEKVFPTSMASLLTKGWDSWVTNFNSEDPDEYDLSDRELDIISCLANGDTNKFIARKLSITESTVKVHLKTILRKLGLGNRTQAAIWAIRNGVVPCPEISTTRRAKAVAEGLH